MKSKKMIESKLRELEDLGLEGEAESLRWVLEPPECHFCNHPNRKELELNIFNGTMTMAFVEAKYNWEVGVAHEHIEDHMKYDPKEAEEVERTRVEVITTLDMAENIFSRIERWLDEWEKEKEATGIDGEWLANATRLVAQANSSLKLIGTLKQEIGVDSQLLLAQQQVNGVMGILVNVLRNEPKLLSQIEREMTTLGSARILGDGY